MEQTTKKQENDVNESSNSILYFIEKTGAAVIKLVQRIVPTIKDFNKEMDEIDKNTEQIKKTNSIKPELKIMEKEKDF